MTIPAKMFVDVTPGVLAAGGNALAMNGIAVTLNLRVPTGTVKSFPSPTAVGAFFGANSAEKAEADVYFKGFTGSTKTPGAMLFAKYPQAAIAACLRGGNISALSLAALQALVGSLSITVDGLARAAGSINLAPATSFSSAATIVQTGLNASLPAAASVTGSIGGIVTASAGATFTGTGSGTNLTTTAVTGKINPGASIAGTGVPAGTVIVSQTSGTTGGAGVYVTNNATTSAAAALVASSNILDVTAVVSGSLRTGDAVSGAGVAGGTTILTQLSGATGGVGQYILSSVQQIASTAVTALSTVLNVTAVISGALVVGSPISGTNVAPGSVVSALLTGAGGIGTYRVSLASTTVSETINATAAAVAVTYDSTSGAFVVLSGITGAASTIAFATGTLAASLLLTAATGAVLSQGSDALTPAAFMDSVAKATTNWASFFLMFDPDSGAGNAQKLLFSQWTNAQGDRYAYVAQDTDVTATGQVPATTCLGYLLKQAALSGTNLNFDPNGNHYGAMVAGWIASIDFNRKNGRIRFAYRGQTGIVASVVDETAATNLGGDPQATGDYGNGYNYYGAVATANDQFLFYQRGTVSGPWLWLDSYVNQIWLNNALQLAVIVFFQAVNSFPYTPEGYAMLEAALMDPIKAGLNFGAFVAGVPLSSAQAAAVNQAAGIDISDILTAQGFFLQILPATAEVRQSRASPPITLWYCDGQSIQAVSMASIDVL